MRESSSRIWVDGLTPPALGIAAVVWLFCSADRDLSRQRREVGTGFVGPNGIRPPHGSVGPNSVRPLGADLKVSATTAGAAIAAPPYAAILWNAA
jgi:hypothetical protein